MKSIPTEEMILAVREKCADHQKILIEFVYETAARVGEAIALDYNEVKNDYVILYTRKSKNSNRVPRFVPRPEFIIPEGTGKVFKEWNAYPRFLEDIIKELGQTRWNWHGLRHRRASIWANEEKTPFSDSNAFGTHADQYNPEIFAQFGGGYALIFPRLSPGKFETKKGSQTFRLTPCFYSMVPKAGFEPARP